LTAAASSTALALLAAPVGAETPTHLHLQGHLTADAAPVTATLAMTFSLHDSPESGDPLWQEPYSEVDVLDGRFHVLLGSRIPLDPALLSRASPLFVGITLPDLADGPEELLPRPEVSAVPYALRASVADLAITVTDEADLAARVAVHLAEDAAYLASVRGPAGAAGAVGAHCWDPLGDADGSGVADLADCRGPRGAPGERGEQGEQGPEGPQGPTGVPGLHPDAFTSTFSTTYATDEPLEAAADAGFVLSPLAVGDAGVIETALLVVRLDVAEGRPPVETLTFNLLRPAPSDPLEALVLEGAFGAYGADLTALLAGEPLLPGDWTLEVVDGADDDGVLRLEGWSLQFRFLSSERVEVPGPLVVGGTDVMATLAALAARAWCREHCDEAQPVDCRWRTCNGEAERCEPAGQVEEGTPCDGGRGRCVGGQCCPVTTCASLGEPECGAHDDGCGGRVVCGTCGVGDWCNELARCAPVCGGAACPTHPRGWAAACNGRDHCEYAPEEDPLAAEIWVPPGVMPMGSPGDEDPREADEGPVHDVTFATGFWIGKHEVTVSQYGACPGCSDPSVADWAGPNGLNTAVNGRSDHPQNGLQWQQAVDYCTWRGMRLPSESEWEYAAKGPVHQKYPWGDLPEPTCATGTAVFNEAGGEAGYGCGGGWTAPVGSKPAGASWSGVLDMSGNLWEWVEDCWHVSYADDGTRPEDGSAWTDNCSGSARVLRGGGFDNSLEYLRAAERDYYVPSIRYAHYGARCLRPTLP